MAKKGAMQRRPPFYTGRPLAFRVCARGGWGAGAAVAESRMGQGAWAFFAAAPLALEKTE